MIDMQNEALARLKNNGDNQLLIEAARIFTRESFAAKYSYNFTFLGRPIIQYPQDIIAMQELIWRVKPDLIIETGIAHGGSLIMSASSLALLDLCEAIESGQSINPQGSNRLVLGIDVDIRQHNREAIEAHPLGCRIQMIQGSSVSPNVVTEVKNIARNYKKILVCLDSNHSYPHVLEELKVYAPLTSIGSYCVVFDTIVEDLPESLCRDRPWGPGNSPATAVREFLQNNSEFKVDILIDKKNLISMSPGGYLQRIK